MILVSYDIIQIFSAIRPYWQKSQLTAPIGSMSTTGLRDTPIIQMTGFICFIMYISTQNSIKNLHSIKVNLSSNNLDQCNVSRTRSYSLDCSNNKSSSRTNQVCYTDTQPTLRSQLGEKFTSQQQQISFYRTWSWYTRVIQSFGVEMRYDHNFHTMP